MLQRDAVSNLLKSIQMWAFQFDYKMFWLKLVDHLVDEVRTIWYTIGYKNAESNRYKISIAETLKTIGKLFEV